MNLSPCPTKKIRTNSLLAEDIRDAMGKLLLAKGTEVTEVLKLRLSNFTRLGTVEQIRLLINSEEEARHDSANEYN